MSISRQNLSIVIVTLKSEKVIHQCIKSLNQNILIIVVEHSDNKKLKEDLEKKYNNLKCILAKSSILRDAFKISSSVLESRTESGFSIKT